MCVATGVSWGVHRWVLQSKGDDTRRAGVPGGGGVGWLAWAPARCQRCHAALTPHGHWPCPSQLWFQSLLLSAGGRGEPSWPLGV